MGYFFVKQIDPTQSDYHPEKYLIEPTFKTPLAEYQQSTFCCWFQFPTDNSRSFHRTSLQGGKRTLFKKIKFIINVASIRGVSSSILPACL